MNFVIKLGRLEERNFLGDVEKARREFERIRPQTLRECFAGTMERRSFDFNTSEGCSSFWKFVWFWYFWRWK